MAEDLSLIRTENSIKKIISPKTNSTKQSPFYTLLLPSAHKIEVLIKNQHHILQKGDILLLAPYIPHQFNIKEKELTKTKDFSSKLKDLKGELKRDKESGTIMGSRIHIFFQPFRQPNKISTSEIMEQDSLVRFSPKLFPSSLMRIPEYLPLLRILKRSEYALVFHNKEGKNKAFDYFNENDQGPSKFSIVSKLYQLLSSLIDIEEQADELVKTPLTGKTTPKNDKYDYVQQVNKYLEHEYPEVITLNALSKIANITRSSLSRSYKQRTSMTPFEYLKLIRIDNACNLLLNTKMPISEISYTCGYNNISLFNKQFKSVKGISPSAYRKSL